MKPIQSSVQHPAGQRGFSLVELMVAMLLGLILSAGVINIYLESKKNYSNEDEAARMQENGRYALNMLKRELTQVGFLGGIIDTEDLTPATVGVDCAGSGVDWVTDIDAPLEMIGDFSGSLDTSSGTTLSCLNSGDIESGTDVVAVKRTAGDYTLKNGSFNPAISSADDEQWYLRVEDYNEDISWVYLGTSGAIPAADATPGSVVNYWEYYTKIFYIREYSESGDGVPTLCVERLANNAMRTECLVEGVEDMQFELGIDSDGDGAPDQFKATPLSADFDSAVAARIYLLVRSVNAIPNYTNTKEYQLGTKTVDAKNDGFLRRVYSTTVQMRNQVLPNA